VSKYRLEVLLPFHIYDSYLTEALDSCIRALPPNSRIIAINTINDQKLLNGHSDYVYEVNHPNAGYISALDYGFRNSHSEYVALMNSDDLIDKDRFLMQIASLELSDKNLCVSDLSKFSIIRKKGRLLVPPLLGKATSNFHEAILLLGSYRADATWCFKSEWARENNIFLEENDISDWCIAMRTMKTTDTVVLNKDLYFYRMHSNQISRNQYEDVPEGFFLSWHELNNRLNFRKLSNCEIELLTSLKKSKKLSDLKNLQSWLEEFENFLLFSLPDSNKSEIRNLLARRRLLISLKNRSVRMLLCEWRVAPKVLFQYIIFRKYLRSTL
jgi:glycosyltransferase involved in cell wall biosynthesis